MSDPGTWKDPKLHLFIKYIFSLSLLIFDQQEETLYNQSDATQKYLDFMACIDPALYYIL